MNWRQRFNPFLDAPPGDEVEAVGAIGVGLLLVWGEARILQVMFVVGMVMLSHRWYQHMRVRRESMQDWPSEKAPDWPPK